MAKVVCGKGYFRGMDEGVKGMECWKCGSANLLETPTMLDPLVRSNGDKLIFTVCGDCCQVNEFVNGKAVRIILIPVIKGS